MNTRPRQDPIGTPRRASTDESGTESLQASAWLNGHGMQVRADVRAPSVLPAWPSVARSTAPVPAVSNPATAYADHGQLLRQLKVVTDFSESLMKENLAMKQEKHMSEYVAVLINGNDLIPTTDWVRLGREGGRHFANRLTAEATTKHRPSAYDTMHPKPIVTKIYADVQGLVRVYGTLEGSSGSTTFSEFAHGFNHCDAHSDLVDVGSVHIMTDERIANQLWHYLSDPNCTHIVLGCRAGTWMTRFLGQGMLEPKILCRVTLMTTKAGHNPMPFSTYQRLDMTMLFVPSVDPLRGSITDVGTSQTNGSGTGLQSTVVPALPVQSKLSATSAAFLGEPCMSGSESKHYRDTPVSFPASTQSTATDVAGNGVMPWAKVASRAANLPFQDLSQSKTTTKPGIKMVDYNAEGRRLDPYMAYDALKVQEMKKFKYCNQHFIGKGCCHWEKRNDNCPHVHEATLSEEDKQSLRRVARETVCKKLPYCKDPDCIYGHHCPYPKPGGGIVCINGDSCRFKVMHGMDLAVAKRVSVIELRRAMETR